MNLKQARKRREMTLFSAAKAIGVNRRTIIRWEQGKTSPSVDDIPAIRDAYGLTDAEVLSLLQKEPA